MPPSPTRDQVSVGSAVSSNSRLPVQTLQKRISTIPRSEQVVQMFDGLPILVGIVP